MNTAIQPNEHNTKIPISEDRGGLFLNYDLSKFKVFTPSSLFPPDFKNLQKNCCPICGRKLYWNVAKSKAFCKSKFKDKFFISRERFLNMGGVIKI